MQTPREEIQIHPEEKIAFRFTIVGGYVCQKVENILKTFLRSIDDDIAHLPESVQKAIKGTIIVGTIAPIPGSSIVSPISIVLLIYIKRQQIKELLDTIALKRFM